MHRRNVDKRAIHTFKARFLDTLSGTRAQFTNFLSGQLLEQAELNINLMRQSMADPRKLSWEYLHGRPFNYDATPLGPLGTPFAIHNKPIRRKSWDYIGRDCFSSGAALNHY